MDNVSVSKGVFAHKGKLIIGQNKKKSKVPEYFDEPWYLSYKKSWESVEKAASKTNAAKFKQMFADLLSFIVKVKNNDAQDFEQEIPTAILLTGVNIPDHSLLFEKIVSQFRSETPYIALVSSRNSTSIKTLVEDVIYQLINSVENDDDNKVIKSRCNFRTLQAWQEEKEEQDHPLVIIIQDFEGFSSSVLHDFIVILSSNLKIAKFVLVFGVATTLHAVHRSLSYDVTSKLKFQVFHMQKQVNTLSDIINTMLLTDDIPFKLTGDVPRFLIEIFLFYDFSVNNFLHHIKICMIEHFYKNNQTVFCCRRKKLKAAIADLTNEEFKDINNEMFDGKKQISRDSFKNVIENFHSYMNNFLMMLCCFQKLTIDLPNNTIGNEFYKIYELAVSKNFVETFEYKELIKLLHFSSKSELLARLNDMLLLENECGRVFPENFAERINYHIKNIKSANVELSNLSPSVNNMQKQFKSRLEFKKSTYEMSQMKLISDFKKAQTEVIEFLDKEIFSAYLKPPQHILGNHIFCYNNVIEARRYIPASIRATVHKGLVNPNEYLECSCCVLDDMSSILPTLPDLSIIYKIHTESRKMINMYDWLQAFLTTLGMETEENQEVDPQLQARFTQAVAELQFLGYIKASKKKTDHVKRLT